MARLKSHGAIQEKPDSYDYLLGTDLENRYRILKKLGEGGMGVVFLARHVVIDKPCAVKVLKRQVAGDQSIVQRFIQEAQAASRIGHPNIVDVTDFGKTADGLTYQVMEFVDGRTLSELIADEAPVDCERAIPIVAQIAQALGAAHQKGIVHRDLKPENVFLIRRHGRDDFVKIVDFGIAKVSQSDQRKPGPRLTRAGSIFGTPEYMSPEQASGSSDIDARSDIYSLGIIFYELLTGQVPHQGENTVRTVAMQILDPIVPPRQTYPNLEISAELEACLMKSLAKKREQRWETMEAFVEELARVTDPSLTQPVKVLVSTLPEAPPPSLVKSDLADAVSTDPTDDTLTEMSPARKRPHTHDPPFVENARRNFHHVDESGPFVQPKRVKYVPWALAGGLVLAALVFLGLFHLGKQHELAADAAPVVEARTTTSADAAVVTIPENVADAAPMKSANDVGYKYPIIKGASDVRNKPTRTGFTTIRVVTDPPLGNLFVDDVFRGPDGTNIREATGTVLKVQCRKAGFTAGTTNVSFEDGKSVAICRMKRRGKCTDGLKNPFEECD